MRSRRAAAALVAATALAGACGSDGGGEPAGSGDAVLLTVDDAGVIAYSLRAGDGEQRLVDEAAAETVPGAFRAVRGICVLPDGSRRFVVAERAETGVSGWTLFELSGGRVGELTAGRLGRLVESGVARTVPTGCAFLSDGRLVTADFGSGPDAPGRLVVWFPPFDVAPVRHCTVLAGVAAPQDVLVGRSDAVFVASAAAPTAGVLRYDDPLPTGPDEEGGCGAPISPALFVAAEEERLPDVDALAPAPEGGLFVASAPAGRIMQYDRLGRWVRTVLEPLPAAGDGRHPTPLAMAVGPGGALLVADAGLTGNGTAPRAGAREGSVRRIAFRSEAPQPAVPVGDGLDRPAGLAVVLLPD